MQSEVTVAVSTQLIGAGGERKSETNYIVLPERRVSAQDLVAEHVRSEIQRVNQQNSTSLALQYLINNPNNQTFSPQNLDVTTETQRAYDVIRTGQCLLMVDGVMISNLDTELDVHEHSRIGFMRLMPLIGG